MKIMKNRNIDSSLIAAIAVFASTASHSAFSSEFDPKVIYGDDDRRDLYEVSNQKVRDLAASTVALVNANSVKIEGSIAKLPSSSFGSNMNACKEEPYYEQPNPAFCSGSLVGPDVILTAGHCIRSATECARTKFVFGFSVFSQGNHSSEVDAKDVYSCKEIIARVEEGKGADFAVIRIDRKVTDRRPLELDKSRTRRRGASLIVIGHPSGLPTKIAGGASVRDFSPKGFFTANLDTYGGNSGSAVFDATNGKVVGVLVRGEADFVFKPGENCRISKRCGNNDCRGEDVTKIAEAAKAIKDANRRPRRPIFRWPFPRRGGKSVPDFITADSSLSF